MLFSGQQLNRFPRTLPAVRGGCQDAPSTFAARANWQGALTTLQKARELRKGNDGADGWFFLAMAHWRLNQKDEAREAYKQAMNRLNVNEPLNDELRRFRAEAAELLGITDQPKEQK